MVPPPAETSSCPSGVKEREVMLPSCPGNSTSCRPVDASQSRRTEERVKRDCPLGENLQFDALTGNSRRNLPDAVSHRQSDTLKSLLSYQLVARLWLSQEKVRPLLIVRPRLVTALSPWRSNRLSPLSTSQS